LSYIGKDGGQDVRSHGPVRTHGLKALFQTRNYLLDVTTVKF
jgi:hypothetical protein